MINYLLIICLFFVAFFYLKTKEYFNNEKNFGLLQGVVLDKNFYYLIYSKGIKKYSIRSNKLIKESKKDKSIIHLNGGIVYKNMLLLTHNPINSLNSIYVFDKHLNLKNIINLPKLKGSLTWIDFNKGTFFGLLAFYGDQVSKTRLVELDKKFSIVKEWNIPKTILNRLYPYSISGGQFQKSTGLLFLTGHDKKEIYIVKISNYGRKMQHIITLKTNIAGQGISFDKNDDRYLWGTDRKKGIPVIFSTNL